MVARPINVAPSPQRPPPPAQVPGLARPIDRLREQDPLFALLNPFAGMSESIFQQASMQNASPTRDDQDYSLEHIRQGLLTIHSLRASIPVVFLLPFLNTI